MILRLFFAAILLVLGGVVTAFGVITAVYRDPLATTAIILGAGLLLLAGAAWMARRARR